MLTFFLYITLLIFPNSINPRVINGSDYSTCNTQECVELSKYFLSNMNDSVDPCDDFYEFACGNHKGLPILHEMQYFLIKDLVDVLTGKTSSENASHAFQIAINYTKSCLNEKTKAEFTEKDFRNQINAKFGGWHLLDNTSFKKDSEDWEILVGNLSLYGIVNLLQIEVVQSPINIEKYILKIGTNYLQDEEYFNTTWTYFPDFMRKFLKNFGIDISDEVINNLKEFDRKIMRATEKISGQPEAISYTDFKNKYPKIKWDSIFNKQIRLGESTLILNEAPEFFEELQNVLEKTSEETIKNFLMWRIVVFSNLVCYDQTVMKFEKPLAAYFVSKVFDEKAKVIVEDMIYTLKKEFNLSLTLLDMDWLENSTISKLQERLLRMTNLTGYPEVLNNASEINRPFANIKFDPGRYLANQMKLNKIEKAENLRLLKRNVDKNYDWTFKVLDVNANYDMQKHEIIVPISISRFPLLVSSAPVAVNYGALGLLIAHEIIHGFDRTGIYKELDGIEGLWTNPAFIDHFHNRTQCLVEQYNREIEPETGRNFDGKKTIDENISDNGGIRIAWKGYQRKVVTKFDQRVLPNMEEYNSNQLFFIAFANSMCQKMSKEQKEYKLANSEHTFGATRVNVALRNFYDFQYAWNCPVGSKMRPEEEDICRVW
ncbi:unnamed protein product [Caenorhabditis angaria]|uniref:Peptidase M13 C-terminal domain-containing protein n=1 Tax=Caenorhabditis angaria TaxID=860376 RepID=A0A9P1IDM1_9PELO|nr:unnamed protein product [Caenorhabditis angaria]